MDGYRVRAAQISPRREIFLKLERPNQIRLSAGAPNRHPLAK